MPLTKRQRQILHYCKTTEPNEPPSYYKVDSVLSKSYTVPTMEKLLAMDPKSRFLRIFRNPLKVPKYNSVNDHAALRDLHKQGYISFRDDSNTAFRLETPAHDSAEIARIRIWEKIKELFPGFLYGVLGTTVGLLLSKLF